jgi:hypothetical protein
MGMNTKTFDDALADFVNAIQKRDDERMQRDFAILCVNGRANKFYADPNGRKYIRIVREDVKGSGRSVHCFVDAANGDILKADGWKRPAKHARGNIFADNPLAGMGDYGAQYLR